MGFKRSRVAPVDQIGGKNMTFSWIISGILQNDCEYTCTPIGGFDCDPKIASLPPLTWSKYTVASADSERIESLLLIDCDKTIESKGLTAQLL
jgi:hypothetical protein